MAIINQSRRINPLDINRNVTIGVAFPLDEVNIFKGTETVREQVKSNLINLLLTEKGERVNEPNFGVGLKKILFEQHLNREELEEKINFQINFYIPEIQLITAEVGEIDDDHRVYLTISYKFKTDGSTDALTTTFQ
jgi:phage baseplate assembly protein W|tara:strand:- start:81 stop:488 length:408 start_codon:yes stop_codon:yes gene_type:complete